MWHSRPRLFLILNQNRYAICGVCNVRIAPAIGEQPTAKGGCATG
jgi:hypothetical protein